MGREPRDNVRAEARRLLTAGVTGEVFPGGACCVSWRDAGGEQMRAVAAAGRLERGGARAEEDTVYDLGEVTQPFVAIAALRMHGAGEIDLDVPVESLVPDVRGGVLGRVTVRRLLCHRGGLAAWGGLYLDVPHEPGTSAAKRWLLSEAARRPSDAPAGQMEQSALGYLVAGEALCRVADAGLDEVIDRYLLEPLGLRQRVLFPAALPTDRRTHLHRKVAPTERCEWRGRLLRGEVQDENAAAFGGVAGHAGLFGTAEAVASFGRFVLDALAGRSDLLRADVIEAALAEPSDGGHLRFGWDTKHGVTPACGRRMGSRTFGRVGFTGASLHCDPDRDVAIALMTNRICPSRANEKIDGFRPAFHDGVMAALG